MAQPAPPISFSTFVISLASSGMADAAAGGDKDLARQTLDLLAVLADKTRGNLDEEEARLLEAVRTELKARVG
jgi:hypothetical protein